MDFKQEILVLCGPMWSGKSNALLLVIDKLKYAHIPYLIFKPDMDRFNEVVSTRYQNSTEKAISIKKDDPRQILTHVNVQSIKPPFTVAIDEAQFFSDELFDVVKELNKKNIRVVISGLDLDAWGKPFGPMPKLLCLATKVIKLVAICDKCKLEATKSAFESHKDSGSNIKVGEEDKFFPLCSVCYYKFMAGK